LAPLISSSSIHAHGKTGGFGNPINEPPKKGGNGKESRKLLYNDVKLNHFRALKYLSGWTLGRGVPRKNGYLRRSNCYAK